MFRAGDLSHEGLRYAKRRLFVGERCAKNYECQQKLLDVHHDIELTIWRKPRFPVAIVKTTQFTDCLQEIFPQTVFSCRGSYGVDKGPLSGTWPR